MNKDFLNTAATAMVLVAVHFGLSAYRAYTTPPPPAVPLGRFHIDGPIAPFGAEPRLRTSDLFTRPVDADPLSPRSMAPSRAFPGATTQPSLQQRLRPYLTIPAAPEAGGAGTPTPRSWKRSATYAALALAGSIALFDKASGR